MYRTALVTSIAQEKREVAQSPKFERLKAYRGGRWCCSKSAATALGHASYRRFLEYKRRRLPLRPASSRRVLEPSLLKACPPPPQGVSSIRRSKT